MQKIGLKIMGGVLLFFLAAHAVASADIKILGGNFVWPEFFRADLDSLTPHAQTIHTIDPNFKADGISSFTGIRIKKVFDLAGISYEKGITVIGADQYVGYLTKKNILQDMAFLVWQMNDKPLGPLKGGPFKIIFPDQAKVHASCYTWYVDTLIAGSMEEAVLRVQVNGRERSYTRKALASQVVKLPPNMLSIPQGCRDSFEDMPLRNRIDAIPLSRLIKPADVKKARHLKLIPLVGPAMTLKPKVFDHPVSIIVSYNGDALHPAFGGPFSLIFPVEQYPELKGLVPESGALFFLEKIIIE